jgi:hypothetical protein
MNKYYILLVDSVGDASAFFDPKLLARAPEIVRATTYADAVQALKDNGVPSVLGLSYSLLDGMTGQGVLEYIIIMHRDGLLDASKIEFHASPYDYSGSERLWNIWWKFQSECD